MTLIQPTKQNGHDPYAYLKDTLTRLLRQKTNSIDELFPHNCQAAKLYKLSARFVGVRTESNRNAT
ncbi:MAG: transposase domain-containing protein [Pseudomonadota bacterium]